MCTLERKEASVGVSLGLEGEEMGSKWKMCLLPSLPVCSQTERLCSELGERGC